MKDIIHITEEELLKRDAKASEYAQDHAEYANQAIIFKQIRDDYLAALKMEIRGGMEGKVSDAELETRARASEQWKVFSKGQREKLKEAGRAKVRYDNACRSCEMYRSALSARKKEMERMS